MEAENVQRGFAEDGLHFVGIVMRFCRSFSVQFLVEVLFFTYMQTEEGQGLTCEKQWQ